MDTKHGDTAVADSGSARGTAATASEPAESSRARGVCVIDRETGSATRRPDRDALAGPSAPKGSEGVPLSGGAESDAAAGASPARRARRPFLGRRWARIAVSAVAVAGIAGTIGFGHAWAAQQATLSEAAAARTTAEDFLLALTNFTSKNVDAQFNEVQSYATGPFESQSNQFFGSSIRQQLEAALASSRGQIRNLYVQSVTGNTASVYGVVDQTYVNDKMSTPAADVLRVVVNLSHTGPGWKISDVTVLNDPTSGTSSTSTPAG